MDKNIIERKKRRHSRQECYKHFILLSILKTKDYDFIFKIDADLVLPKNYIERVVGQFQSDKKIGICGGVCVVKNNQNYEIESVTNLDHRRGAIKCYRKMLDEIGGLVKAMDGIQLMNILLGLKGWDVKIISDLEIIHKRPTHLNLV